MKAKLFLLSLISADVSAFIRSGGLGSSLNFQPLDSRLPIKLSIGRAQGLYMSSDSDKPATTPTTENSDDSATTAQPPAAEEDSDGPAAATEAPTEEERQPEIELTPQQKETLRLREAEKFIERETDDYTCTSCTYKYVKARGDFKTAAPDTAFDELPEAWTCPRCGAPKSYFKADTITIAGFEENQQYGFGTNQLTEGQKSLLIFGGLFFFFALFLSGYLLE